MTLFQFFFFFLSMTFFSLAQPEYTQLLEGIQLRFDHRSPPSSKTALGTVVLLQGRSSYIEKFDEIMNRLVEAGYEVWTFDWRGTGGSSRLIKSNPQKVYIDSYASYIRDLDHMLKHVIPSSSPQPVILLGISMGGHIALRYVEQDFSQVAGAFLVSPMLNIHTNPYPVWLGRLMVENACRFGLATSYVIGYGDYKTNLISDPEKVGTTDFNRYQRQLDLNQSHMSLVTSGPTYGWVNECFKSIDLVNDAKALKKVTVPVMIIQAGNEFVVDASQDQALCAQIPQCRLKTYTKARHNIFIEAEDIQQELIKDFNTFVSKSVKP